VLQEFVWLGGTLIAVLTNSTTAEPRVYYAYSDHLNAARVIVNAVGDVRWRWISEPFGTTAAETIPNSLENLVVNLRFPGQYFDKESGLSYNYFRDYDGTTGRYVQSDPIGLNGGINTYAYVDSNPLAFADPTGTTKVILVKETDPVYPAAVAHWDDPNLCIVISHGSPNSVNQMKADQLAATLVSKGCKKSQPIILDACRAGQGEYSIAEQLAKRHWNASVRAPTERIWNVGSWENPVPYGSLSEDLKSKLNHIPDMTNRGTWRTFDKKGPAPVPTPVDTSHLLAP